MTRKIDLSVNDSQIEIDYFVQSYIDHVVGAIIETLEGTSEIKNLELSIQNEITEIILNGELVPLNTFVNDLIKSTIVGMISILKGINGIGSVSIVIER